jgi:UDP-2,3-diacylglucosamine pyrophosphatase LpxH
MRAEMLLAKIYRSAQRLLFDDRSRIVLMSDCHRGNGSHADNYMRNQNICAVALEHYFSERFTYVEIGDGDELWENEDIGEIIDAHKDAFWLLSRFYAENRLYMIFGNHDMVKRGERYAAEHLASFLDDRLQKRVPLFPGIRMHEGLVLRHQETGKELFLVHGHQADYFNEALWKLARFLVRYLWRPLETLGVNDPTSAAKNYRKGKAVEDVLTGWVRQRDMILVAGHTHRPAFPDTNEPRYFNTGSCVHPRCATAIEITDGRITLVKWCVKAKPSGELYIGREPLAGPVSLQDFFK